MDGVGEWVTATYGVGRGNDIKLHKQIEFPHSLGLLYSAFTAFLGFEVNEGEYKVMGMAPYGEPRYVDKVWKMVQQNSDGSFALDMDYFCFHHSTDKTFNRKLRGSVRRPAASEDAVLHRGARASRSTSETPPANYGEECRLNQHYADVAASIQRVTEELMLGMANKLYQTNRPEALCIAGGVAPEQRRQQPHPARNPVRRTLHPTRGRRRRRRTGCGSVGVHTLLGKPRNFSHGSRVLGTRIFGGRNQRFPAREATFRTSISTTKTSCWIRWSNA